MSRFKKTGATMSRSDFNRLRNSSRVDQIYTARRQYNDFLAGLGPVQGAPRPPVTVRSPTIEAARKAINASGPIIDQIGDVTLTRSQMAKLAKAQRAIDRTYGAAAAAARASKFAKPFAGAVLPGLRAFEFAADIADLDTPILGVPALGPLPTDYEPNPADGWVLTRECNKASNGRQFLQVQEAAANPNLGLCLNGQVLTAMQPLGTPVNANWRTLALVQDASPSPANPRGNFHRVWNRPLGASKPGILPKYKYMPRSTVEIDPNVQRALGPEVNIEALVHAPLVHPLVALFPRVATAIAEGTTARNMTATASVPGGPPFRGGSQISSPGRRTPPPENTHERKGGRGLRLVLAIADSVSEGAEVVDAFFEALPKGTQKHWGCNRRAAFIDVAGQYGIDNADCKLKALYHNWHKVNMDTAIKNIIANHIEDKVIGGIQKLIPRNTGGAIDGSNKTVSKGLDALFKAVGLKD